MIPNKHLPMELVKRAAIPKHPLTLTERWEQGVPHDPRSVELYKAIEKLDFEIGGDFFCFKSGGDGDNGEHLMYLLDVHFETRGKP